MKIFAYEFITGGGMIPNSHYSSKDEGAAPDGSLLAEGSAMILRLAEDLAAAADVDQVTCLWDNRLPPPQPQENCDWLTVYSSHHHDLAVMEQAADADWTILIAPEFDGHLERIAELVFKAGGRLLGPNVTWRRYGTDKDRFGARMGKADIPCPTGLCIPAGATLPYCRRVFEELPPRETVILKPNDGAGCEGVRRYTLTDFISFFQILSDGNKTVTRRTRIETFRPRTAGQHCHAARAKRSAPFTMVRAIDYLEPRIGRGSNVQRGDASRCRRTGKELSGTL